MRKAFSFFLFFNLSEESVEFNFEALDLLNSVENKSSGLDSIEDKCLGLGFWADKWIDR